MRRKTKCSSSLTKCSAAWASQARCGPGSITRPSRPDLFSFGKKAQICGLVAGPRIDEVENNCFTVSSRINSTWGGTVVDMVRAQRYLEIYRDDKILDYVSNVAGPALYNGLKELEAEFPKYIRNVRGKGLMCAYDICSEELRNKFLKACQANNMLILGCGANTVRFRPGAQRPPSRTSSSESKSRARPRRKCLGSKRETQEIQRNTQKRRSAPPAFRFSIISAESRDRRNDEGKNDKKCSHATHSCFRQSRASSEAI